MKFKKLASNIFWTGIYAISIGYAVGFVIDKEKTEMLIEKAGEKTKEFVMPTWAASQPLRDSLYNSLAPPQKVGVVIAGAELQQYFNKNNLGNLESRSVAFADDTLEIGPKKVTLKTYFLEDSDPFGLDGNCIKLGRNHTNLHANEIFLKQSAENLDTNMSLAQQINMTRVHEIGHEYFNTVFKTEKYPGQNEVFARLLSYSFPIVSGHAIWNEINSIPRSFDYGNAKDTIGIKLTEESKTSPNTSTYEDAQHILMRDFGFPDSTAIHIIFSKPQVLKPEIYSKYINQ